MRRLLDVQQGQAMILVLAFMLISVPVLTATLGLVSTLLIDSRVKSDLLKSQYSALGAQQYIIHSLVTTTTLPDSATSTITLNGVTITTTAVKLALPPFALPFTSRADNKLLTTKVASPASVARGATTTYTITVRNQYSLPVDLDKIWDELPKGVVYYTSSASFFGPDGSPVTITDSDLEITAGPFGPVLKWDLPQPKIKLQPNAVATLKFVGQAVATIDGVYCNEVYAEPGNKRTRSGKTAKLTVGSPSSTVCRGTGVTFTKKVSPEVVFGDTAKEYTYTITVVNEGTESIAIKQIDDFMPRELTYVPISVSSTPSSLNPGEPKITLDAVKPTELEWEAPAGFPWQLLSGDTWLLEFKATGSLSRGFYANEVEVTFDKSKFTVFPSTVATLGGSPEYTYKVEIENDGTQVLVVEEVNTVTAAGLTYVVGSTTSTAPYHQPVEPSKVETANRKVEWDFAPTVSTTPGSTWTLEFKATKQPALSVLVKFSSISDQTMSVVPVNVTSSATEVEYTFEIPVANTSTVAKNVTAVNTITPNDDYAYKTGSATSTSPGHSPDEPTVTDQPGKKIEWTFSSPVVVSTGTTWTLQFMATTSPPEAADITIKLDGVASPRTIVPTSITEAGNELEYTYDITVENTGSSAIAVDKEIKAFINNEYTYKVGSSTSTSPFPMSSLTLSEPKEVKLVLNFPTEIIWLFDADVSVPMGGTWTMQFKATGPVPDRQVPLEVSLKLIEHPDTVVPPDRATGPTAIITALDAYEITADAGGATIVCDVWFVKEIDVGEYQIVQGCSIVY